MRLTMAAVRAALPAHPWAEERAYLRGIDPLVVGAYREALRGRRITVDAEEGISAPWMKRLLRPLMSSITTRNRKAWGEVLRVPIPDHSETLFPGWVKENTDLITNLQTISRGRAQATVEKATREGWAVADLTKQIQVDLSVSRSRARLIARDQTLKINASITRESHTGAGINSFIWICSMDERSRESHRERHNKHYPYSAPPNGVIPGEEFQCRCSAYPDLGIKGLPELR